MGEDETRGRIIVPSGSAPYPLRAIVLYVGDGYRLSDGEFVPLDLHPGDEVLFFKGNATEMRLNDESVLLLHERDVLVVTDPAPVRA